MGLTPPRKARLEAWSSGADNRRTEDAEGGGGNEFGRLDVRVAESMYEGFMLVQRPSAPASAQVDYALTGRRHVCGCVGRDDGGCSGASVEDGLPGNLVSPAGSPMQIVSFRSGKHPSLRCAPKPKPSEAGNVDVSAPRKLEWGGARARQRRAGKATKSRRGEEMVGWTVGSGLLRPGSRPGRRLRQQGWEGRVIGDD